MTQSHKRPDPSLFPGIIPLLGVDGLCGPTTASTRAPHVAVAGCQHVAPSEVFDTLRDVFYAVRKLGDAPVCFVAPSARPHLLSFVDALALMPELVLAPPSVEREAPGTIGMIRQFGARWIAVVSTAADVEMANHLATTAGFRGAPALLASTVEALEASQSLSKAIFGVDEALADADEVWAPIASSRCMLARPHPESALLRSRSASESRFPFPAETIRLLLGINEIREPCG